MNSNLELSKEMIDNAVAACGKHYESYLSTLRNNPGLSVEEAGQMIIMETCNVPQIEAEEIINDLKKGLDDFDTRFNKNKEAGKINVIEYLKEAINGKSEEESKEFLVNILSTIELLDDEEIAPNKFDAKIAENSRFSNDELISKIEVAINDKMTLDTVANGVKNGLDLNALSGIKFKLDKENRLLIAVMLYVEQYNGNIKLSPEQEIKLPATVIGALAGASAEILAATDDLKNGEIDLTQWQKILKYALGALLMMALLVLAFTVVAGIGLAVASLMAGIFGWGVISVILALAVSIYIISKLTEKANDMISGILEKFADFYNNYIGVATERVKSWIAAVKEWINRLKTKAASHDTAGKPQNADENTSRQSNPINQDDTDMSPYQQPQTVNV